MTFYEHDEYKETYIKHLNTVDEYFTRKEDVSEPFEENVLGYVFGGIDEFTVYAPDYLRLHTIPKQGTSTIESEYLYYKMTEEQIEDMQELLNKLNE